jgi:thioredoxin 1
MNKVTDETFQEKVIESDKLTVVKFTASWCGPCKQIQPLLEEIEKETPDVIFWTADIDENREKAKSYSLRSVPQIFFFKNGEVKDQIVGTGFDKAQFKTKIETINGN